MLLYGLVGEITVDGHTYNNVMTPWAQLGDEELADVLNSWSNPDILPVDFALFTPDELAAQRDLGLSSEQVYEERQSLELAGE